MTARLGYRKLMLYHNIMTSDNKRTIKKIVHIQKEEGRETTWNGSVEKEMVKYNIKMDPTKVLKSTWKEEVKSKITAQVGEEIRRKCMASSKGRNVTNDEYQLKEYLSGKTSLKDAKRILLTRLNMNRIPGNFRGSGDGVCPLCKMAKGNNEHYFKCQKVKVLAEVWEVQKEDLVSQDIKNIKKMKSLALFMEKVEVMVNPI